MSSPALLHLLARRVKPECGTAGSEPVNASGSERKQQHKLRLGSRQLQRGWSGESSPLAHFPFAWEERPGWPDARCSLCLNATAGRGSVLSPAGDLVRGRCPTALGL